MIPIKINTPNNREQLYYWVFLCGKFPCFSDKLKNIELHYIQPDKPAQHIELFVHLEKMLDMFIFSSQ